MREAAPTAAASLRGRGCKLACLVRSLRAQADGRAGLPLGDEVQRLLEEAVRDLERAGTAYFEEHCGPHLGRLCDHEAVWG